MKIFVKTLASVAALTAALLATTVRPARAQNMPVAFDGLSGQMAMIGLTNRLYENNSGRTAAPAKGKAAPARAASFAYAPTPALKAATVQGAAGRLQAKNPAAAQAITTNFGPGKNDYGQIYQGIIQGSGLPVNDAAAALAAYTTLGWMIVNDVRELKNLPAGAPVGLRQQLLPKLSANAQLTAPGVAAKLGEELKLMFVVLQGGWQSSIKEGKVAQYRQGVAGMFKNQYGTDLAAVKLTPQGFAAK